ncbi:pyrimidine dimer DNA glycosylase/endonuclease V [Arsenophonus sp.]|uniref:pyrimidine dimer DNA glycosylase/endonuclease V n=1 Tax=Arsenophonus sp. TaxID=1872640 RepID=UPI0028644327|nr:pyrimidine dimer DNA glycosylase/endonuclease V [Arsenophonus sp.]MDR5616196.1 pyrimidine dimer DNA glycosylase/endonuclease V [Arsenophonus sp.]
MTRINVIPPSELCDQHLLAEHRELTRIPNYIVKKEGNVTLSTLTSYTLGKGHVIFFRDKLLFLHLRYTSLHQECLKRGFSVINKWPEEVRNYSHLWKNYQITELDIMINKARIDERMPLKPRFTPYKK